MITFFSFIFTIGMLVIFHELGHFIFARRAKIKVEIFAIGLGPTLISFKKNNVDYKINLIPLGGYVKLAGMEDNFDDPDGFNKKTVWERVKVIAAGPFVNFFLALIIFCLVGMVFGVATNEVTNVVWRIFPGSEAERIGLKVGDRIIEISGKKITRGEQMLKIIHNSAGKKLTLKILRKNEILTLYAIPQKRILDKKKVGLIGFNPKPVMKKYGPIKSISEGVKYTFYLMVVMIGGMGKAIASIEKIFTGGLPDIGGPILIYQMSGQAASFGMGSLLFFIAVLSVNVGIFMLIPFPPLDGGHILFLLIELFLGKPIDLKKQNFVHTLGFAFLIFLMILVAYGDLIRWLSKPKLP